MTYKDYLSSDDWREKKHRKTKASKKRCSVCSSEDNIDLHHLNYKNLYDVELSDLRFLCRRCHFLSHRLFSEGKIKFYKTNHHSRFTVIKNAIKKELGLTNVNMFYKDKVNPNCLF